MWFRHVSRLAWEEYADRLLPAWAFVWPALRPSDLGSGPENADLVETLTDDTSPLPYLLPAALWPPACLPPLTTEPTWVQTPRYAVIERSLYRTWTIRRLTRGDPEGKILEDLTVACAGHPRTFEMYARLVPHLTDPFVRDACTKRSPVRVLLARVHMPDFPEPSVEPEYPYP